ncbi:MAG: (d)CMP kinase [Flavobacteriales bacterium]|nr:(d)CMP kinase [Flavobacteriales bacterium]
MNRITIAIDGYSSCGKSTLAKQLAKELGYTFVDSGAMYRAVALYAMQNGCFNHHELNENCLVNKLDEIAIQFTFNASRGASDILLNGKNVENEIRQMDVSNKVSQVAAVKEVRKKLVAIQQEMGRNKGVVMDGRDIGTVVFPHAELKIFMTARPEVRAARRYAELETKGEPSTLEEVRKNLETRDNIDTTRKEDPLKQAEDAIVLDNSGLSQDEQLSLALNWVSKLT